MAWKPVAPENKITARKYVGDAWVDVEMKDLLPGDIFKAVDPRGEVIDPCTNEPDDDVVALVTGYPIRNDNNQIGSLMGEVGYGVPVEVFESMSDLQKRGLS